jgi:hypothetical protein
MSDAAALFLPCGKPRTHSAIVKFFARRFALKNNVMIRFVFGNDLVQCSADRIRNVFFHFAVLGLPCRQSLLDIMTSDGGRLTPDMTRVSLPKPEPLDGEPSPIHSEVNHVPV